MPGGGTGGSALAGPSWLCSAVYWAGVSTAPVGFSGPVTCVKSPLARSWLVAVASGPGLCHTGVLKRNIRVVGFADDCGKCLVSSVCPVAESLPAGRGGVAPHPSAVERHTADDK